MHKASRIRRTDFSTFACSIARSLEVVGDPWTLLILRDLVVGLDRFDELQRNLGVATNILSGRLKHLVVHGLVAREADVTDARVARYRLTPKGWAVMPALVALMDWGDEWAGGDEGPPLNLRHAGCGGEVRAVLQCQACGERVQGDALELQGGPGGRAGPGTALLAERLSR